MRNGIRILLTGCLLAASIATVQTGAQPAHAAAIVANCKCGKPNCRRCRPARTRCRKCPKCENDVCQLSAECVNEKKICFEVEQKLICVPKISLPWRKCEQPCCGGCEARCRHRCGKTKTIKVLRAKTYECPTCKYSWKVFEPELAQPANTSDQLDGTIEPIVDENIAQPEFEQQRLFDPSGDDVPEAPKVNRNN